MEANCGEESVRGLLMEKQKNRVYASEIHDLVTKIAAFQEAEMPDKMLSFYSDLMLNYEYFWKACKAEGYMKIRVAGM